MDIEGLTRVGFKHLLALHVMLDTCNVTKAAEQLSVTPSSVSKTITQLREILDDELFFRDGTSLTPTPYAVEIAPLIHSMLASMNGLLNQARFEPSAFEGRFSLSMRESTFELFAHSLAKLSTNYIPKAKLNIMTKAKFGFGALHSGQVDFIILPHDVSQPPTNTKELVWEVVLQDELVCLMSPEHPLADVELTVEHYLNSQHIGIAESELSRPYFEQTLRQQHGTREVKIVVPDFGAAAVMCHQSELLFTCSKHWADVARQAKGLTVKTLPFEYGKVAYSVVWNRASINDPAVQWLCTYLRELEVSP
ncbi:LysR family transcriptional regulator [Vibrio sp. SCSIO 43140]|uniref:LysR family transcriptional regulator n=1 Tax=Vibrio TaxID=662 RepID=UPI0020757AC7|nr:LysR family transcriptional regulator [Vibrio sp. SCSIO 43140]USD63276.1 LysR family transcriptional regulator [Vibrio sp. SCSIO 43140]